METRRHPTELCSGSSTMLRLTRVYGFPCDEGRRQSTRRPCHHNTRMGRYLPCPIDQWPPNSWYRPERSEKLVLQPRLSKPERLSRFSRVNVMVQWGSAVSTKNVAVTGSFPSPTAVGHLAQQKQKRLFSVHRFGLAIPTWMRNDFGGFAALLYMCSYYHSQDASGAPTTPVGRTVRSRVRAPWNEYRGGVPVTRGIITGPGDGQAHDSTVSSRFIHGSGF